MYQKQGPMTKAQLVDQLIQNLKAANPDATETDWANNRAKLEGFDTNILKAMVEIDFTEAN